MSQSNSLPHCVYDLDVDTWDQGLVFAHCRFEPKRLNNDAFLQARIPEPDGLQEAIAKRRCEYLAGRVCATAASEQLTGRRLTPTRRADRSPQWPAPLVGAITHSHGRAAALVGHRRDWQSLGIDYEVWLSPQRAARVQKEILTEEESQRLDSLDAIQRARCITRIFSAKESLFKALYPLTGQRFYFQDATLFDDHHILLLTTLSRHWPKGTQLPLLWHDDDDGVLSRVQVPTWST